MRVPLPLLVMMRNFLMLFFLAVAWLPARLAGALLRWWYADV